MRLVCISDTHYYPVGQTIPDGDILIHAGDLTKTGTYLQIAKAGAWIGSLPHKHKIVVAGNHDKLFEKDYNLARLALGDGHNGIQYLQDQVAVIKGLVFYGAPWSVEYHGWAFGNTPGTYESRSRWEKIPMGVDVLITHGPAKGILDKAPNGFPLGDSDLSLTIERVQPRIHVHGHIHHSYGMAQVGKTLRVNAALCDEAYVHMNKPIVLDVKKSGIVRVGNG